MGLKVVHFPSDDFLNLRCTGRRGLEELFEAAHDPGFTALAQGARQRFDPGLCFLRPFAMKRLAQRSEVIASMMEVEGLEGLGKPLFGQIPEPDRPVHDEIDGSGSAETAAKGLGLHGGSEVHGRGLRRGCHDMFLHQKAPATGAFCTSFKPVDDGRLDLVPGDPLRILPPCVGPPVPTALAGHPAVEHDHQAEGRFGHRDSRCGQFEGRGAPAKALGLLVDAPVAGGTAPGYGDPDGSFVGADLGGGVSQTSLELGAQALVGLHPPMHARRTYPAVQRRGVSVTDAQGYHADDGVESEIAPAGIQQSLAGLWTNRGQGRGFLLKASFQTTASPLAFLGQHGLFESSQGVHRERRRRR